MWACQSTLPSDYLSVAELAENSPGLPDAQLPSAPIPTNVAGSLTAFLKKKGDQIIGCIDQTGSLTLPITLDCPYDFMAGQ